jgi:hypothetical protein
MVTGNYKLFTSYNLEDILHFIGKERIEYKIEELRDIPSMGEPFQSFLETDKNLNNQRGVLSILKDLTGFYFRGELDVSLLVYKISKRFSKDDYINNDNYWLDVHYLYLTILDEIIIQNSKMDCIKSNKEVISEIRDSYTKSIDSIVKNWVMDLKKLGMSNIPLYSNGVLWNLKEIYEELDEYNIVNQIEELNNSYPEIWSIMNKS